MNLDLYNNLTEQFGHQRDMILLIYSIDFGTKFIAYAMGLHGVTKPVVTDVILNNLSPFQI